MRINGCQHRTGADNGTGVPDRPDFRTGAVARIAVYSAGDDGAVIFTVDSILGGPAMICAAAGNPEACFSGLPGVSVIPCRFQP